jgi:hypothetical protein
MDKTKMSSLQISTYVIQLSKMTRGFYDSLNNYNFINYYKTYSNKINYLH